MPFYERAPEELVRRLQRVTEQHHQRLADAGVTVDLLLAYRKDSDEFAVKAHGYGALATVKITSIKDRVKGVADAEIVVDGDHVDEWSEREFAALLDHELTHLELVTDKQTGVLKRDDHDRPKLTMRLHDRQMGWFDEVARRWGEDSPEVNQSIPMVEDWEFCQLYLPGFDPSRLGRVRTDEER